MNQRILTIDIYSDVICPWCYVGKRRLERALRQLGETVSARVTWRPFQLNPAMPLEGMTRAAYLVAKFGSLDAYRRLEAQVTAAEPQLGWAFDKITVTPHTFAAHRLIWYAEASGKQDAMVETLFRSYFVEGRHIGQSETLVEAAAQAGLRSDDVEAFLKGDDGVEQVQGEEAAGRRLGIRAVPCFVLNGAHALSGAQPAEVMVEAIRDVLAQQDARLAV